MKFAELTEGNLIAELLHAVPEVRPLYEEELSFFDEGEDPGLWNLFGTVFTPYWEELLLANEQEEELRRVFAFLERMATSADENVYNVVAVSCVENLGDDYQVLGTAYRYMGPATRELSYEMEHFWGRVFRENLLRELLDRLPEMKPLYEEVMEKKGKRLDEELGLEELHEMFRTVFTPYWFELLQRNERKEELHRTFSCLDRLACSLDKALGELLQESCLKELEVDPDVWVRAYEYMEEHTRALADGI